MISLLLKVDILVLFRKISPDETLPGALSNCTMPLPMVDLPAPDSPTRPSISPGLQIEANLVHRTFGTVSAGKLNTEILDGQ